MRYKVQILKLIRMKKYLVLSLFLAMGGSFLSCNDKLDLQSDGSITMDGVFTDRNRTRGYLNACYGYRPGSSLEWSSYTDEAEDCDDITANSAYDIWYNGGITLENFSTYIVGNSPWSNFYQGIRKCNVFLENIGTATAYASEDEKAGWTAQAYTLRAYYYLQLFKRYGEVPLVTSVLATDYNYSTDKKASIGAIVTQIIADCDAALAQRNNNDAFSWDVLDNQFGIMTRAVAYAIKSEAITYAASPLYSDGTYSWSDAVTITKEALSQCLNNDYKLFDMTSSEAQNSYALYFLSTPDDKRAVDKETIYGSTQVAVWSNAGLPTNDGMSKAGPCPTQDLIDAYEMANGEAPIIGYSDGDHLKPIVNPAAAYDENNPYEGRDPRFYASIYFNGAVRNLDDLNGPKVATYIDGAEGISETNRKYTRTGYYMRKYNHYASDKKNNRDGYIRIFRLAELYLNFAEAAYQVNGPDEKIDLGNGLSMSARDAVNAVRRRVGMPDFQAGMTKDQFEKKYRNERRIELAFEGHRYFDVRRWKIMSETDKFVTGMRIIKDGDGYTYNRFRFTNRASSADKYLLYPIDKTEANKMLELTGNNWQNAGW